MYQVIVYFEGKEQLDTIVDYDVAQCIVKLAMMTDAQVGLWKVE